MDKKLDENGDLVIENNDVVLVDGLAAIKQDLSTRLGFFQGEWFANTESGFPWFKDVLIKNPDYKIVGELVKKYILATNGTTELIDFRFEIEDEGAILRQATLTFRCLTTNGVLKYSDSVGF